MLMLCLYCSLSVAREAQCATLPSVGEVRQAENSHAEGGTKRTPEIVYYADAYADHYGVPRELVYAMITQESGWKPKAVSSKGALGLMQLLPATAAQYGVHDPFDISENIGAGVHYLADLIAQFHDWRLAVASYYCGPTYPLRRGLRYANPEVVAYVRAIHASYYRELLSTETKHNTQGRYP